MARGQLAGAQALSVPAPVTSLSDIAIHTWVNLSGSQSSNNRIVWYGNSFSLGFQTAGTLLQVVDEGIAWRGAGTALSTGVWIPIGLRRVASGSWFVFVNGVSTDSGTATPPAVSSDLYLGNSGGLTVSLFGAIGPTAVWSSTLPSTAFAALAKGASPLITNPATLAAYWGMFGANGAAGGEFDMGPQRRPLVPHSSPGVVGNPGIAPPFPV